MISFFISTIPRGQARVRHAVVAGHSRAYKAKAQVHDEQTLQALMMPYKPDKPFLGPLTLRVTAIMPIPSSRSARWRRDAVACIILPTVKPDLTNIAKNIEDVMQSLRFFDDDKQVCRLMLNKRYGSEPGYSIVLEEM
jgi:Holliday junction resolvase RusA-like endonuclease